MALSNIQESIQNTISDYLEGLRMSWEDSESLIVRISLIEAKILNVEGILDVSDTTINEQTSNIEVAENYLPVMGSLEVLENETN